MKLVGISYGGFVGYNMAIQLPEEVERLVLCFTGVCLEEKDLEKGLFPVAHSDEAASILLPQTPKKLRELMKFSFVHPIKGVPWFFLHDFINVMCKKHLQEERELIGAILKDRELTNLPRITQVLITSCSCIDICFLNRNRFVFCILIIYLLQVSFFLRQLKTRTFVKILAS